MLQNFINAINAVSRRTKISVQIIADSAAIFFAIYISVLSIVDFRQIFYSEKFWIVTCLTVLSSILIFKFLGIYRSIIRYTSLINLIYIGIGALASVLVFNLICLAFDFLIHHIVYFIYIPQLFTIMALTRVIFRQTSRTKQKINKKKVAIFGAGEAGRQLLQSLGQNREYSPVLLIDDNPKLQKLTIENIPVHDMEKAGGLIKKLNIKTVLLAIPSASLSERQNIFKRLEHVQVEVKTLPSLSELIEGRGEQSQLRQITIEELIGRDQISPISDLLSRNLAGKSVLVTGAGGSIGQEVCIQVLEQKPNSLILLDNSEYNLYRIHQDILDIQERLQTQVAIVPIVCSIINQRKIKSVIEKHKIQTIFHAAALKHVPLMEQNIIECVRTNIFGTKYLAEAAVLAKVENFTLISTDKAVRPTNIMGATKRVAELICQSNNSNKTATKFSIVRFGNVLDSSGSVIPLFQKQLRSKGPLTVTHKDITRFFMSIPEAAQLVIQAGAMARGGEVFVLDMGQPLKIVDLAKRMISLHGYKSHYDTDKSPSNTSIEIKFVGLRPGEKLYEELTIGKKIKKSEHPRIMLAEESSIKKLELNQALTHLEYFSKRLNETGVKDVLINMPIEFISKP